MVLETSRLSKVAKQPLAKLGKMAKLWPSYSVGKVAKFPDTNLFWPSSPIYICIYMINIYITRWSRLGHLYGHIGWYFGHLGGRWPSGVLGGWGWRENVL